MLSARRQPRREAGVQRTLYAVACTYHALQAAPTVEPDGEQSRF